MTVNVNFSPYITDLSFAVIVIGLCAIDQEIVLSSVSELLSFPQQWFSSSAKVAEYTLAFVAEIFPVVNEYPLPVVAVIPVCTVPL